MRDSVLLRLTGLSKSYDGVQALRDASFELRAGEVHALVGENGAGKSTLIRIITGAIEADAGQIELYGKHIVDNSPAHAKANGIAAIYQQPALFPDLSVAENLAFGLEGANLWKRVSWSKMRCHAVDLLAKIGAEINPDTTASDLPMPQQQMVEIAKSIGADARVIVMDEPTASLSDDEIQKLFAVVSRLRSAGVGIIYISHRLDEVLEIADRVTVLRDGRTIETRSMQDVTKAELITLMVGRELSSIFPKRAVEAGETALELRKVGCSRSGINNIDLVVRKGEIVGLAGLVGAGRTELARTIFGLTPADQGEILVAGRPVTIASPEMAIRHGIAYLPEDRRKHGVIAELSITDNITLASLGTELKSDQPKIVGQMFSGLDFGAERQIASSYIRRFGIKTPAAFSPVSTLSGGNQQKVALSRWLATDPKLLILDEPTQGIDVGAKAEIHELMMELVEQGMAILMISSELPEILGMSDRIAVMRNGTICGELDRADATQERLLSIALGHQDPQFSLGQR
ncbi:MAG TPA: sugar ABC transporter ATP-binding protein [Blastocatellia bacterium]|nr:sugar ABC transporter ATP-binding protein [Blastocatellia bacterium]